METIEMECSVNQATVIPKLRTRVYSVGSNMDGGIYVKRQPFTQKSFDRIHRKPEKKDRKSFRRRYSDKFSCSRQKIVRALVMYLPIINVLRYYKLKDYFVTDLLGGLTIGILHIPQALAFGLLTSVKVENGLYTSVWPVLLYIIFGTSPHVSMGTSAVICIVTASVIDREADKFKLANPGLLNKTGNTSQGWEDIRDFMDFKESTAMGITFFTGIILIGMGILKLGFITAYLSDSFFSAFTSGAGVHIATSQIPAFLGLKVQRYSGVFKIVKTYSAIFGEITNVNVAAVIVAVSAALFVLFVKDIVNEKLKKKLPVLIPGELIVVIIATIVSHFMNLAPKYNVDVVGKIPDSLPLPVLPSYARVENYIVDCFVLAILIFANTIAMAKICAKRHNYEVHDSQELIAYGMCNFVGSFLRCFPTAVAPPRSMVASSMNTKTTLNGVFSAGLLLTIILLISALFEPLPKSALAAIIVVALKGLFIQLKDCVKFWRVNKIDFVIWLFTLVSVVFLDIDFGLGIGVIVSLVTVVFQAQFARGYRIGHTVTDTSLVEHAKYIDSAEIPGVKIYRYRSNLFFANAEIFRTALYRATVNPRKLLKFIKKQNRKKHKALKVKQHARNIDDKVSISSSQPDISEILINDCTAEKDQVTTNKTGKICHKSSYENNNNNNDRNINNNNEVNIKPPETRTCRVNMDIDRSDDQQVQHHYHRNCSITTIATAGSERQIDPEDGQELVTEEKIRHMRTVHHVILDMSTVNYMDISGANVITHIYNEFGHVNIKFFLANVASNIRRTMRHAGVFDVIPQGYVFLDIMDAIAVAKLESVLPIPEEGLEDFSDKEAMEDKYVTMM